MTVQRIWLIQSELLVLFFILAVTTSALADGCPKGWLVIESFDKCPPGSAVCKISGYYKSPGSEGTISITKTSNACAQDEGTGLLKLLETSPDGQSMWVSRGDVLLKQANRPLARRCDSSSLSQGPSRGANCK